VGINLNLKTQKVERPFKQNSFKLSFESRSVRDFSNVMWETVPCRRSCIGKASLGEFDACPWSDVICWKHWKLNVNREFIHCLGLGIVTSTT